MSEQLSLLSPVLDDATSRRLGLQSTRQVKRPRMATVDVPRAAAADPDTSHVAADALLASGELNRQQVLVRDLVRAHEGTTSAELAQIYAAEHGGTWRDYRPMIARRLPELVVGFHVKREKPRACRVTKSKSMTWWPK